MIETNILAIDALLALLFTAGIAAIAIQSSAAQPNFALVSSQLLANDIANLEMRGYKIEAGDLPSNVCADINNLTQVEKIGQCEKTYKNIAAVEFLEFTEGKVRVSTARVYYS